MMTVFEKFYRQLGWVTFGVLLAGLIVFGVAILCALLGFSQAVASFRGVAFSISYVFGALFCCFLLISLVAAVIRWLARQSGKGTAA